MVGLADAGARFQAIISGSAVNQDGRSSSLTSPHGPSQKAVMHAAWAGAGLSISSMTVYQGHLTGTSLGKLLFSARYRTRPLKVTVKV
jgi:acyl transferase domain-containing protein